MVSTVGILAMLAGAALPAAVDSTALAPGDSSALEAWRTEDAAEEGEGEAAFLAGREGSAAAAARPGARPGIVRGRLAFAGGGRVLVLAGGTGALRAEALLARESGESRPVDDAYGAIAWTPAGGTSVRAGWFEPRIGAGLVLGPRRVTTSIPLAPPRGATPSPAWFAAPLSSVPARAAAGFRGVAIERAAGAFRLAALAAWTPREARASGAAARPLLGVRHRTADEEARRGRLAERVFALAAGWSAPGGRWRAWGAALLARTDPRREPYDGTSAAAESAATIGRGGPAGELGAAWSAPGGDAALEAAAAFDDAGRLRARVAGTARGGNTRAGVVLETEARGFVPPRAVPESRPRAHVAFALERRGRIPARIEAHALDRGTGARPRLGLALSATPLGALRLEARHDGEPRRTLLALRVAERAGEGLFGRAARLSAGVEARFDPAGLARRTTWLAGAFDLPLELSARLETRLGGGRSGAAWLDEDVSGGRLVRPGPSAGRVRAELLRRGRLAPRLSWTRTTAPDGHSDDVRVAVDWVAGPASSESE